MLPETDQIHMAELKFTGFEGTARDFMASIGNLEGRMVEIGDRVGRRPAKTASVSLRVPEWDETGRNDLSRVTGYLMADPAINHALDVRDRRVKAEAFVYLWGMRHAQLVEPEVLAWIYDKGVSLCFRVTGAEDA